MGSCCSRRKQKRVHSKKMSPSKRQQASLDSEAQGSGDGLIDIDTEKAPFKDKIPQYFDKDPFEKPSPAEKGRNLENFVVIWLNENMVSDEMIAAIRAEVNSLEIFYDVERCIRRIFSIETEKIFLIVSGAYYEKIAYLLESYEPVESIYIFCSDPDKYELYVEEHSVWKEYKKITGVFKNINDICNKIRQSSIEYARRIIRTIAISQQQPPFLRHSFEIDKLEASFMYFQLIKDILMSMAHNENAKKDLFNLCRLHYTGNPIGSQRIDEFEHNYHLHNAIWWYTKEYFLYAILNKALRIQDIETLFAMRFFIADIHHQLEQLRTRSTYRSPFKVYRGQSMTKEEFLTKSNKVGGLISFGNLLSCSTDVQIALTYVDSQDQHEDMVPVLFQITVDPNVRNIPCADVTSHSYYNDSEQEFLFSMGTVFRIQSVQTWWRDRGVKLFALLLTSDEDEDLNNLREYMRQEIGGTNGLINFGRLLIEMGDLNQSEKFYRIVFGKTNTQNDPRIAAMIYNDLGFIASQRHFKEEALQLYEKALDIGQEWFPLRDAQLSPILNNIGEIYLEQNEIDKARENFEEALEIDRKVNPPNIRNQAIRYHNIGMVYKEKEDYRKALENLSQSLKLKQSNLPPTHPSIAISLRSIGDIYRAQGRFAEALNLCEKALNIEESSLPSYHPSLSTTHRCIALIYRDQNCMRKL